MRSPKLSPAETADAAITAALIVALLAAGRALAAGSLFQVVAAFVVAVLAARRRTRTVVIATCAAAAIALILGGLGPVSQAALAGIFGWCGGQGLKRGWGKIRTVGLTLLIAWPAMAASVLFFYPAIAINKKLRDLVFENVENQASGIGNFVGFVGSAIGWVIDTILGIFGAGGVNDAIGRGTDAFGRGLESMANFLIDNWLLLIPATELVYSIVYALAIHSVGRGILRRLERALTEPIELSMLTSGDPEPLPLSINDAVLHRNGVQVTHPISLTVGQDEHLVIEGPNGSGKSTLLDALAGIGNGDAIGRAGAVGLGSPGGTARVGQRPEAQVIGTTVEEDLRWGIAKPIDVAASLAAVGLHLPGTRPTSELSGGELQRLALASALNRSPSLLIADEVTSMLDPAEQRRVVELLDGLQRTTVVRTTHRDDSAVGDRRMHLTPLRPTIDRSDEAGELRTIATNVSESRLLRLRDVAYSHNATQPWAHSVLNRANLSIHRYEMVVIEGRNGSGKTTLARILAGQEQPTDGAIDEAKGLRRALAHQHVRLQLLKATVSEELASLAGVRNDRSTDDADAERQRVRTANLESGIALFGLTKLLEQRIDELSGGEQRRVLLAGLVARGVSLLVLDEPLAGLDVDGRRDLAETLDNVRLAGTSVVVVSHDTDWSPVHVDQHLRLDDGRLHPVNQSGVSHSSVKS